MSDLKSELTASLDEAEWSWLVPHVKRDAVIVVASELNLVEVGLAIVNDQSTSVQHWIAEGLIYKPSDQQKSDWNADQTQTVQCFDRATLCAGASDRRFDVRLGILMPARIAALWGLGALRQSTPACPGVPRRHPENCSSPVSKRL